MSRVLLAVDLSYQVYRAAAAHRELTSVDGVFTGGLYGFLASFGKMVRETGATEVVACRDSKPYRRSEAYPAYKQLRKEGRDDELYQLYVASEGQVLDLLAAMGVPVWAEPGFESDDLIGALVRWHRSRYARICAASNDSDLYQLLDAPGFSVYRDSIATAVDRRRLEEKTGLTPEQHMLATALQGTHNDIEGIKGVGEITAAKIVKDPAMLRRYRASHGDLIERNLALIRLPHPELDRSVRPPRPKPPPNADRVLYRYCARFDIDCTLQMANAFEQVSRG